MTELNKPAGWIDDIEIENAQVKWPFSNFDGDDKLSGPGNYNFTIILDDEQAERYRAEGWNVKTYEGRDEGDPPEHTLKVIISYKFDAPHVYLIKGDRKFRATERDLADIRRDTLEQLDVIISPSRWSRPNGDAGVSAYVKELYAQVKQSRFSERYADYEDA